MSILDFLAELERPIVEQKGVRDAALAQAEEEARLLREKLTSTIRTRLPESLHPYMETTKMVGWPVLLKLPERADIRVTLADGGESLRFYVDCETVAHLGERFFDSLADASHRAHQEHLLSKARPVSPVAQPNDHLARIADALEEIASCVSHGVFDVRSHSAHE